MEIFRVTPYDLLRLLYCDIKDVDYTEFVRTDWMRARKPKTFLEDGLCILSFIEVVLLLI